MEERRSIKIGIVEVQASLVYKYAPIGLGIGSMGRILVVVYTTRGDRIRIISARKATRQERSQYESRRT